MRIKKGFVLRELLGEHVITGEGVERVNFNKIISLNSTAAYLWESVKDADFTAESLADLLTEERALEDSQALIDAWKEAELIED